jgi:quinoprotein glucose dehydrogenase
MKLSAKITGAIIILFCFIYATFNDFLPDNDYTTWKQYGGGPDQSKYFNASQITKENVNQMQVAWVYPSMDSVFNFFSPIVVDTIMYVMAKNYSLVAINALTGKEIWIHANLQGLTRRGINYWESKDRKDRRLLFTLNNTLQAIDALTGKSVMTFGKNGYVDMREGLDRPCFINTRMQSMMPGVIFEDLIIMGSAPGENYFSAPGHIRAYNIVTGKRYGHSILFRIRVSLVTIPGQRMPINMLEARMFGVRYLLTLKEVLPICRLVPLHMIFMERIALAAISLVIVL